ncbi:hypothetical protein [Kosmotoga pacifica]|nr:hypothetical protein [Kosmotoga pacifica]
MRHNFWKSNAIVVVENRDCKSGICRADITKESLFDGQGEFVKLVL